MISDKDAIASIKEKIGFVDRPQPESCGSCRHAGMNLREQRLCMLNDTYKFEVNHWSKCNRFAHTQ